MHSSFVVATQLSVFVAALVGCATAADAQDERGDDAPAQAAPRVESDSALGDAYTYYELTADLRRCPSPLCGGWFLTRLNRPTTRCVDGRPAATCYAPVLDWSGANLSGDQQSKLLDAAREDATSSGVHAIVRGEFAPTNTTPQPGLGRFVITEAWVAEGDAMPQGEFVRVRDNGLRCFAAPCPDLTETTLNTPRSTDIAALDWTASGLTEREIEALTQRLGTPDGILVAGERYTVHVNGQNALGRTVTVAYERLSDTPQVMP